MAAFILPSSDSENSPSPEQPTTVKETTMAKPQHRKIVKEIDQESLNNDSLDALQGTEQRAILDVVDKLRRTGLSNILQLPQLVVCGDQSSGKSSVLEAITEIPFPRKENLCTRFATEIVLRREATSSISTRINPDKGRPQAEQNKLRNFNKNITDFSELPKLIDEATELMGLGDLKKGNTHAFSRDVLSIEIAGPKRAQITLVDLPGLIHAENKVQTKDDVRLIRDLVDEYIRNPRTIILAVISAKNDYANQIILNHVREVDVKGQRTLGIITKPDSLRPGSENERDWMELAKNENICFELGWHMLKNRGDGDGELSFEARNQAEALFFSKGRYNELSDQDKGIASLRTRLSELLSDHLKREIPDLRKGLEAKLKDTTVELLRLGKERSTVSEQRQYLMSMATEAHDIIRSAINGNYDHEFFGIVKTRAPVDSKDNLNRLRAVVQHLNIKFAEKIRTQGHKYAIDKSINIKDKSKKQGAPAAEEGESVSANQSNKPMRMNRKEAINWVLQVLQRSRGRELPGNFNPMLISQLFWEQSEPWEGLALAHIERIADVCSEFVNVLLEHVATVDVGQKLLGLYIDKMLHESLENARKELKLIISDKAQHPITYNHYYTTTIQRNRQEKLRKDLQKTMTESTVFVPEPQSALFGQAGQTVHKSFIDPAKFTENLDKRIEEDMDAFSAEDALNSQAAFYKDEMKYFIDVVTKQVVERHIVKRLPENVLSPNFVAGLTDEEIKYVAGEPTEISRRRHHLVTQKAMLEKGQNTFRYAMGRVR